MESNRNTGFLDYEEELAVLAELKGLPDDHPAKVAWRKGFRTVDIAKLVEDSALVLRLKVVFADACDRMLLRSRSPARQRR